MAAAAYRPDKPATRDIDAAARRITALAWWTPLIASAWLTDLTGAAGVWLKLETVQATGSFKIRGAANAVARLREIRREVSTVMTASAGNHGLALATAAAHHGLNARVHLPATAPAAKRDALRRLGAEVVEAATYDEAEAAARAEAATDDTAFISPYDDDDVIAGAATVTREMLIDQPALDTILVPVGGGGLVAGAALAARTTAPKAVVIGVEAAASPVFTSALAAGHPVTVDVHPTLADGLAGNMDPASRTFGLVRDFVGRVVAVDEDAIGAAMRELLYLERVVVEGAGATALAALIGDNRNAALDLDLAGRHVGVILSGRNVDRAVLDRVLSAG
jgi:threonine dehydratase